MTDKELKKLSRAELLELLLIQTRESESLRRQLDASEQELKNREIRIREAGSLANAAMEINGVLFSAQKAAQQYLDNIARMEEETRSRCQQMLEEAMDEAERIRKEAAESVHKMEQIIDPETELPEPEEEVPEEPEEECAEKVQTVHPAVSFLKEQHRKLLELMHKPGSQTE